VGRTQALPRTGRAPRLPGKGPSSFTGTLRKDDRGPKAKGRARRIAWRESLRLGVEEDRPSSSPPGVQGSKLTEASEVRACR